MPGGGAAGQTCCGQPAYNSGDRAGARDLARAVIEAFLPYDYTVVPSGSCGGMVSHHYPGLFADDPALRAKADALAAKTFELIAFLTDVMGMERVSARLDGVATYHDSCSGLRELGVKPQPRRLLASVRGLTLKEMRDPEVCCGFGGTFCVKYPGISTRMVTDKVRDIAATGADTAARGRHGLPDEHGRAAEAREPAGEGAARGGGAGGAGGRGAGDRRPGGGARRGMSVAAAAPLLASRPPSAARALHAEVAERGFARVPGAAVAALLGPGGTDAALDAFAASWERLETDAFMADGGRYRRRRHANFTARRGVPGHERGPHRPHFQEVVHNSLNGGVERWFAPVEEAVGEGAPLRALLDLGRGPGRCAVSGAGLVRGGAPVPHRGGGGRAGLPDAGGPPP